MSSQARRLRLGLLATLVMVGLASLIWGRTGAIAAGAFGALATGIQLLAARWVRLIGKPATPDHMGVYMVGMLLRVAGVAVFGLAVTIDRATFPPGPAAVGYLGSLLPLMWLETRLT